MLFRLNLTCSPCCTVEFKILTLGISTALISSPSSLILVRFLELISPTVDQVVRHARGLPGPREKWLSFAVSDPAVLDVILFISALDLAGLRGKSESHDTLYFKGEAIRVINKRLRETSQVATDGTIAAVASLTQLEVCLKLHLKLLNSVIDSYIRI
jgi:hypothetical protein